MVIERVFRIKPAGDQYFVDRGTGAGWEPYKEGDYEDFYDVDPQFYQVMSDEVDFTHVTMDGVLYLTAQWDQT